MKFLQTLFLLLSLPVFAGGISAGATAPAFNLKDLDGKTVSLADYKNKIVVLEWFNPDCPFVKNSHTKGSLVGLAKKLSKPDVVWLAVNSGAPGKQGNGIEKNKTAAKAFGMEHPILVDESGEVGKAYGATNTPHLFIIGKDGKLVYSGAIDNSPDGEKGNPEGGTLVNFVEQALIDLAAGKPVKSPTTKPYGCSVKYGS